MIFIYIYIYIYFYLLFWYLKVETFGSMERREKTDFILEQMRLCLLRKDYTRVQIISKKISQRFFEQEENNVNYIILLYEI